MQFEYLLWSLKSDQVPALVSSGPPGSNGHIDNPSTTVLLEGNLNQSMFMGGRVTLGVWFDCRECFGMMGSFFMLNRQDKTVSFGSPGDPPLFRPFFSPVAFGPLPGPSEAAQKVAFGDQVSGSVSVNHSTQLLGADLNFRWNLCQSTTFRNCEPKNFNLDLLLGVRYLRLEEQLTINEDLLGGPDADQLGIDPGTRILLQDRFATDNNFYGGQIGLMGEWRYKRWFLNFTTKVALGATQSHVAISGSTTDSSLGTASGGLLALEGTNIGSYNRTAFSIVPEVGVSVGYQLTQHCRVYVGYNLLFWTNVARPGDQIDRTVNPRFLPFYDAPDARTGPARPAFAFRDTNFWAQGLVAGLEWRF